MKALKNLKKAFTNVVDASAEALEVSTEILADATSMATNTVSGIKPVSQALLESPFEAAVGYKVEQGMDPEQARKEAFKYVDQDVADTIRELSQETGALLADLFKEEE